MEMNLSEICNLLGGRIEKYNSVAKKRRIAKVLKSIESVELKRKPPMSPASFSSVIKRSLRDSSKRHSVRRHLKVYTTNMRKLAIEVSDESDQDGNEMNVTR